MAWVARKTPHRIRPKTAEAASPPGEGEEPRRPGGGGAIYRGRSWEAMVGGENWWLARPGWGSNRARLRRGIVGVCQGVGERARRLRV